MGCDEWFRLGVRGRDHLSRCIIFILHMFIYISSFAEPNSGPNMGSIGALLCSIRRWAPASPPMHKNESDSNHCLHESSVCKSLVSFCFTSKHSKRSSCRMSTAFTACCSYSCSDRQCHQRWHCI